MMSDVNIAECKFNTDIVPYMYGELSASESSEFETHLLDCVECTDEFASISSARYEVYDWKKLEFDSLATPHMEIPYEATVAVASPISWPEKVRLAFGRGWAIPGLGFAALAVISIFAGMLTWSPGNDNNEVVRAVDNSNTPTTSNPIGISTPAKTGTVSQPEAKGDDRPASRPAPLQAASNRTEQRRVSKNAKLTQTRAPDAKQASTQNEKMVVPRLNDFAEDEDTSLRLAELFDDIETRD
jgi:hypothetical protein